MYPLLQRSEVIAQMGDAGGLDAREYHLIWFIWDAFGGLKTGAPVRTGTLIG
jgi:hypothetical protein